MKKKQLKLFVWEEFGTDYTQGIAFAIAETAEQAQELVIKKHGRGPLYWGEMQEYDLTPMAVAVTEGQ
jgi:hypothetical protein